MKRDLSAEQLAQPVTVTLPLSAVLRLAESESAINVAVRPVALKGLPTIGSAFEGGIYAGLSVDGEQPVALVLLSGDEKLDWKAAGQWAEKQGGVLPSRIDQLVLFKNLKAEFKKEYYWSGEQFAGDEDCAWYQYFLNGYQGYGGKDSELRVRAVRRLPIQ